MITAIKQIDSQTVLVETSGGLSEAIFIQTLLRGLGDAGDPAGYPDGFRVLVKGAESNDLGCWSVRDRLAQDHSIQIHDAVDRYVERKRQRV